MMMLCDFSFTCTRRILIILSVVILTSESFLTCQTSPQQRIINNKSIHEFRRYATSQNNKDRPLATKRKQSNGSGSGKVNTKRGRRQSSRKGAKNTGTFSPQENRQLNQAIVKQENAQELLKFLASTKGALSREGGGGALNSINFSTSLHRVARHIAFAWQNPEGNDRSKILIDPRFALLVSGVAEAMTGCDDARDAAGQPLVFGPRELSNIAWAIAKLKIAPPKSTIPIESSEQTNESIIAKSKQVRKTVLEVARQRAQSNGSVQNGAWVPVLSELCGYIMDGISHRVTKLSATEFRLQEYANLLWALATAQRADENVFRVVISSLMRGMQENGANGQSEALRPQEWSNSIWALATAGISGPEKDLFPFVADLMDSNPEFLEEFKPQELSNTVWGIATIISKNGGQTDGPECEAAMRILRHIARQLIKRDGQGYKSQEMTNSVWAFATLGFGLGGDRMSSTATDYTYLPSDDPKGDQLLVDEAFQVARKYAYQNARRFRSQELNNFAWTMARFGQKDEKLLNMFAIELANPKRRVSSQDIGTSLWSFATLEYFDHDLYRAIANRVNKDRSNYCKPQELSNTLWALATADVVPNYIDVFDTALLPKKARPHPAQAESDPVIKCISTAAQELMRRPQDFKSQEIKDILWALSRMGIRFPTLFKFVAEHLVGSGDDPNSTGRGLEGFSQQGIGNLAWSFARQAQLGDQCVSRNEGSAMINMVSGRLAHYTVSYIDIGEGLLHKLFYGIAETDLKVHDNLSKLSPQDLSNTAWAFAILGMKHDPFLDALANQLEERMNMYAQGKRWAGVTWFKGQELANALWALATLNYNRTGLLSSVEVYLNAMIGDKLTVSNIANVMKRQELANIAWACAVFGDYPSKLIEILYMGLLGIGDNSDPDYVQLCYNDGGIQSSAVMSVVYLQTAMDSELSSNNFSLPSNFPEKWGVKYFGASKRDDIMADDTFELELKSSRIQLAVGSAFDRIGFDHVQEHVISMDSLASKYGISVASNPKEILSVDIAQVDSKIGIEVDGPGHFITDISNGSPAYEKGYPSMFNGKLEYQFKWSYDHQELNGPTALKERILTELGWQMINIPFWSWYSLQGNTQKEEDYCQSLLES